MSLEKLIVIVEEPSAERALDILLPRLLGLVEHQLVTFRCKQELLRELPKRLRAYSRYLPDTWKIVVLLDRDRDDCIKLKADLDAIAVKAGLTTKSSSATFQVINRIAIEELEAWYFGDWEAVRVAYPRVSEDWNKKSGFRNPDEIAGGTWERLERILKQYGYFQGGLRKVELAASVAAHMNPDRNSSPSFQAFVQGVRAALGQTA